MSWVSEVLTTKIAWILIKLHENGLTHAQKGSNSGWNWPNSAKKIQIFGEWLFVPGKKLSKKPFQSFLATLGIVGDWTCQNIEFLPLEFFKNAQKKSLQYRQGFFSALSCNIQATTRRKFELGRFSSWVRPISAWFRPFSCSFMSLKAIFVAKTKCVQLRWFFIC